MNPSPSSDNDPVADANQGGRDRSLALGVHSGQTRSAMQTARPAKEISIDGAQATPAWRSSRPEPDLDRGVYPDGAWTYRARARLETMFGVRILIESDYDDDAQSRKRDPQLTHRWACPTAPGRVGDVVPSGPRVLGKGQHEASSDTPIA